MNFLICTWYTSTIIHWFEVFTTFVFFHEIYLASVWSGFPIIYKGETFWPCSIEKVRIRGYQTSYKISRVTFLLCDINCIHSSSVIDLRSMPPFLIFFSKSNFFRFYVALLSFRKERLFGPTLWKTRNLLGSNISYKIWRVIFNLVYDMPCINRSSFTV